MNILNSIGGGLLSGVRGVGQGLAAAGGGINKYINAMGMDSALSAGIPQDQLTPQAMRGAGRNWLASIGQGMQTGDYVGARQDMQKEMLAKVQMLQQMKQQEAAKQRMAQFQQAAQQVDPRDPASVASLSRAFPEFSETIGKMVDPQHTLAQTAQANATANKANVDAWLSQLPKPVGVKEYKEGISSDGKSMVVYAFMDDGTPKETGIQVPSFIGEGGGYSFNKLTGETKGPEPKPATTELLTNARELQKSDPNRFPTITSAIDYLKPKSTPGSAAAAGGKSLPNMPQSQFGKFKTSYDMLASFTDLAQNLNDGYFGHTAVGDKSTWGQALGAPDILTGAAPGQATWWSQFSSLDNDIRHGKYGAALTPSEIESYKRETVDERTDPAKAREILGNKMRILGKAVKREYTSARGAFNHDQLEPYDPSPLLDSVAGFLTSPNPKPAQPGKPFSLNPQAAPKSDPLGLFH